ncbi:hypothetical protein [Oceanivirga salmonicida]|nr:hypothetical protein [Oceanivirga salmonicida]
MYKEINEKEFMEINGGNIGIIIGSYIGLEFGRGFHDGLFGK